MYTVCTDFWFVAAGLYLHSSTKICTSHVCIHTLIAGKSELKWQASTSAAVALQHKAETGWTGFCVDKNPHFHWNDFKADRGREYSKDTASHTLLFPNTGCFVAMNMCLSAALIQAAGRAWTLFKMWNIRYGVHTEVVLSSFLCCGLIKSCCSLSSTASCSSQSQHLPWDTFVTFTITFDLTHDTGEKFSHKSASVALC